MTASGPTNDGQALGRPLRRRPVARSSRRCRGRTHFDWRLAPYDLAGSRAHANVLHARRAAHRRRARRAARAASTRWASGTPTGTLLPGPVRRGRPRRARAAAARARSAPSSAASCAPAAAATTRSPRCSRSSCATTPASIAGLVLDLVDALADAGRAATSARSCPAARTCSTPSRCCSSHHLLAHAWPLVRDVERLRDWDARVAADSPYGSGALAGLEPRPRPRARSPRELGFTGSQRQLDRRHGRARLRRRVRLRHRDDRRRRQPAGRGGHPLGDPRVRLRHARRRLLDRVEHHAAEEEPRHRRAGPRQGRPADRQPRPGCWPRSRRCRWPTTATCRRTRSRSSTPSTPSRCCCRRSPAWSPR